MHIMLYSRFLKGNLRHLTYLSSELDFGDVCPACPHPQVGPCMVMFIYPRSGVSCNRPGHFGWSLWLEPVFQSPESLLELQTDRRRLLFEFYTFQRIL